MSSKRAARLRPKNNECWMYPLILFPETRAPLARGTFSSCLQKHRRRRTTPAYAGNIFRNRNRRLPALEHPRLCGEYSMSPSGIFFNKGPPLMQGTSISQRGVVKRLGTTPARAGNIGRSGASSSKDRDHPRSRGEHIAAVFAFRLEVGPPPLARGTSDVREPYAAFRGTTPARAGNILKK